MKKWIFAVLTLVMAWTLGCFCGCGTQSETETLDIVCTIFPQYDWTKNLTEGNNDVSLTLLQASGVDLHNYQATAADKVKIMNCDLLIYIGGESDEWVEDCLKNSSVNPDQKILKLMDEVDALTEEDVPGGETSDETHDEEPDEHIWLSLKNAVVLCRSIAKALQEADPSHETLYESNLESYLTKLETLDSEYAAATQAAEKDVLVFADRFPFRYLVQDYGLSYYAAFRGCSAETGAALSTITNLAKAIDENALSYLLVLEGSDRKIAEQVIAQTALKNQTILELNSIQSVTRSQIDEGIDYLRLMQTNLEVLKTALR